jgi:hypothetical protein
MLSHFAAFRPDEQPKIFDFSDDAPIRGTVADQHGVIVGIAKL